MLEIHWPPEYQRFVIGVNKIPEWMPQVAERNLKALGFQVVNHMRRQIAKNRYRGHTQASIRAQYIGPEMATYIGPTLKRGNYDAGEILQKGTRPIPNAPYGPIKRWAKFRGLPAWPVWYKIRTRGVNAHPFLDETLARSLAAIKQTNRFAARLLAVKIINYVDSGAGGSEGVGSYTVPPEGLE